MGEGKKVKKTGESVPIKYDAHFLESIYEGAELPMFVLDVTSEGDFIFQGLNPAHERISGMNSDKIKGKKPEELTDLPPEARKAVKANYTKCLKAKKPIQYKEMIPMKGREVHWLTTLTPLKDQSGRVYRIVGTAMYINELIETQLELEEHKNNLQKKVDEQTKEIKESEEHYRLATEATNQGIWDWDVQTNEVFFSKIWKKQIGYNEKELANNFDVWIEHLHPDDKDRSLAEVENYLKNPKGKFIIEFRFRHKKGHYIWIRNIASSKKDSNGKVLRMFGAHSDITKQKQAEENLKESEEKYKTLTESSRDQIFIIDEDMTVSFANQAAAKSFGTKPSNLVGKKVGEIFPSNIAERQKSALKYVFESGKPVSRIAESEFPNGKVWLDTDLIPLRKGNGKVDAVMGVSKDVTEKINRQKEIENKTKEYLNTLDNAPALIWKSGPDAKCYWFNKEWLRWTGRTMEQEVGDGWAEGVHKDDFDRCLDIYLTSFKARKPFEMEYRLRKANGHYGWILDIGKPSFDVDGKFTGYIGYCFDIDDRIKKEEQIEASEEKHRAIFEATTDALIIADYDDMKIVEANPAASELYGYKKEELIGMTGAQLVHPDSHYKFADFINSIKKTGSYRGETTDIRKDESTFETEVRGSNINFKNRPHLLAVIRDVSEKRRAEKSLRLEKEFTDSVINAMPGIFYLFDQNGKFIKWNNTLSELSGYSHEEVGSKSPLDFIAPHHRDVIQTAIQTAFTEGEVFVEADFLSKNQKPIPHYFTGIRIMRNNEPLLLGVGIDISRRKKAEQEKQKVLEDLNERMKEITCLYNVNEIFRSNENNLEKVFKQIVDLIPEGWLNPENTCAKIEFEDIKVTSSNYEDTKVSITEDIIIDDEKQGIVKVNLLGSSDRENHFINEEKSLLKQLAFNITQYIDRMMYEEALTESEEHFRKMLQHSPLPKVITDLDGKIELLNDSFKETLGYTSEEIPNVEEWWPVAYPDPEYRNEVKEKWEAEMLQAFEENRPSKPIEAKIKSKNGEIRYFSVIGSNIGEKVLIVFNDLTDRLKAEERFINLFNNSPVSIWEEDWSEVIEMIRELRKKNIDDYGAYFNENMDIVNEALGKVKILNINKETQTMFRAKDKEDLVNSLNVVFATEDTLPGFIGELVALAEGKTVYETEMKLNTVDGDTIETLLRMTFPAADDTSGQVLVSIMDISVLKEAEAKLQKTLEDLKRSNQELEQFAYVASHDLQEPLRMVSSYTQLLERRYKEKLDDDARDFIHFAVDGANRMQVLINDLLQYSRVTTRGKDFESADLNILLGEALVNNRSKIEETRAIITNEELPEANVDPSQITRLFQNLITNGIKYRSNELPRIHISSIDRKSYIEIRVKDNGIGIAAEFHKKIFKLFERLHTKEQYEGTGIGLAVCKRIVERHGGKIWVESTPGEGSTFHFTIKKNL